ncbi:MULTISPECIES: zinc-ribbon domain-containing protein [Lachnospiraceae]
MDTGTVFCTQCGAAMDSHSMFCTRCGARLKNDPVG